MSIYTSTPRQTSRVRNPYNGRCHRTDFARPTGEVASGLTVNLRRQRQIEHVHRLGPRAVGELLYEVAKGEDLDRALEPYQRLTPNLLKAVGGDRFPPAPIHEVLP